MHFDLEKFRQEGYLGPFNLCDKQAAEKILQERFIPPKKLTWYKSPHEKSPPILKIASNPAIIEKLNPILGDDVLLWGSHFICQPPEGAHGWHLDVEHGSWDGVTLWIGLKNLNEKTTVSLISYSHLLNIVPNELNKNKGISIYDDEAILNEAKKLDPRCELKTFTLNSGEFIMWSGRVWHTTLNKSDKTRFSMILQYCSPDSITKIPLNYEYPDTKWSKVQPPCILISGQDNFHRNNVIPRSTLELSNKLFHKFKIKFYLARYLTRSIMKVVYRKFFSALNLRRAV